MPPTGLHHGMVKPRDIRATLRGKIDPEIGKILVGLAEDSITTRQMLAELASIVNGIADVCRTMQVVANKIMEANPNLHAQLTRVETPNERIAQMKETPTDG